MLTPALCTAAPQFLCLSVDSSAQARDPSGRVIELSKDRDARGRRDRAGTTRSTRMPDMVALSDSHWIVVYNEYPTPLATGHWARIVQCTTRDAGETWTTAILDQQRDRDRGSLGNWNMVRINRLADGRLALTSTTRTKGHRCYLWFSGDEGETWDGPVDACLNDAAEEAVGSSVRFTEASRVVDLPDSTLAVLAHRNHPNPPRRGALITDLFVSGDAGVSWQYRSSLPWEHHDLCEPAVVVRDEKVTLYCRDNRRRSSDSRPVPRGMVVLTSEDAGESWEVAHVATTAFGHQPAATLLADGRVLTIYRLAHPRRVGVDVWVHDPDTFAGEHCNIVRVPGSSRIYDVDTGSAAELSDGTLLLCYATVLRPNGRHWAEKRVQLLVLPPGVARVVIGTGNDAE